METRKQKKTTKAKCPFKNMTLREYKNIAKQVENLDLSLSPQDLGSDATESIAIDYFLNNYGLKLKSLEESTGSLRKKIKQEAESLERADQEALRAEREHAEKELRKKAEGIQQGETELLDKAGKIRDYFFMQNLGCENITLLTQFAMFGYGTKFLFEGPGGIGKSRATVDQLERLQQHVGSDPRIKVLSGHITPKKMYETFYNYRERGDLLVIDETFFITNNNKVKEMFKDACFRGTVYWDSSVESELPPEFEWKGNIIMNSNGLAGNDPSTQAFLDRLMVFKIVLSNQEVINKIMNSRKFEYDKKLEEQMSNRILQIRMGQVKKATLTTKDEDYLYSFVCERLRFLNSQFSHASFRTIEKSRLLYECFKTYFGGFNKTTTEWFEEIATEIIKGNYAENFIVSCIKKTEGTIKTTELRDLIMEHYGIGRTQAYEKIKNLKNAGLIEGERTIRLNQPVIEVTTE